MCLFLLRLSRRIDPPPRSTSEHAIERPMTHRTSNTLSGSPPAVRSVVYGWSCAAVVLYPKERPFWVTGAHRGARGTLDEFKLAWGGRLAHDGGPPKILWGNLVPAAIADRRIGLQPCAPRGRGWLVCNLAYTTDRHRVLQEVDARPAGGTPTVMTDRHCLARYTLDTGSIPGVGTAYLSGSCKTAAKYLCCCRGHGLSLPYHEECRRGHWAVS